MMVTLVLGLRSYEKKRTFYDHGHIIRFLGVWILPVTRYHARFTLAFASSSD